LHVLSVNNDEPSQELFKDAAIGFFFTVDDSKNTTSFADDYFIDFMNPDITDKMSFQTNFLDLIDFSKRYIYRGSSTISPYSELTYWTIIPESIPIKSTTRDLFSSLITSNQEEEPLNREI